MAEQTQIDPRTIKADAEYLRMSPQERLNKMAASGHNRPEAKTDEQVISWFKSLGEIGEMRLKLAQEKNNDLSR